MSWEGSWRLSPKKPLKSKCLSHDLVSTALLGEQVSCFLSPFLFLPSWLCLPDWNHLGTHNGSSFLLLSSKNQTLYLIIYFFEQLQLFFPPFKKLMYFITFIVVQQSSQPNFIAFPSQTPSSSPNLCHLETIGCLRSVSQYLLCKEVHCLFF